MSLFGVAVVAASRARGWQLARNARHPQGIQERSLKHLIWKAKGTAFGRSHGFDSIRSIADFRERVPLRTYTEASPWFLRALEGEPDVIWPGKIPYFGWSSGTTAGNKYLPISIDSVRQQQRGGFDTIAPYLRATGDTTLFDAKGIMVGGSSILKEHASGVLVGDNTGIMIRYVPKFMHNIYRPSAKVRELGDWDDKIAATVTESLNDDIRILAGTPAWFPGIFDRLLEIAKKAGKKAECVMDVWPNLRVLVGGGISFDPYRPLVEARLGKKLPYIDQYSATEGGVMGVQDRLFEPGMQLLIDNGDFYEFIPIVDLGGPSPRRLSVWEVQPNEAYALAVSTPSGIFGYLVGDCVRFIQTFPHRFVFEGRTASYLSVTGEHVSQGEIERAFNASCSHFGTEITEFTVIADIGFDGTASRHLWFIELAPNSRCPNLSEWAKYIDEDIISLNGDYECHRQSQVGLRDPVVRVVPSGTFHDWMKARGKLGGQNKVPRVIVDPQAKELFLQTIQKLDS